MLPTFPLHADRDFRIGREHEHRHQVQRPDRRRGIGHPLLVARRILGRCGSKACCSNCAVNKSTLHIDKPGRHTLRIRVGDPGIVLQKIVLDFGGMKRSYLGPQSTLIE